MKEYIKNSGAFSPNMCRRIIKEILAGIEVIHEFGLAHRDLKPENILIDSSFTLKISDFGIACKAKSKKGLFLQQIVGTPSYQSP